MLKRSQVLLEGWQMEYIRYSSELLDLSFSETARILISEAILSIFFTLERRPKIGITQAELSRLKKKVIDAKTSEEERHKLISKVYFEARKAAEKRIGR